MKPVIVVFGGSFNPPLYSHFSMAEQIVNEYSFVDRVIFVPVNRKYNKPDLIDNEHRYQMLELVCKNNPKFSVSRIEIDNSRQLYTRETLNYIQKEYPEFEIWFTIGSDNLKLLSTWDKPETLVEKYKILIHEREKDILEEIIEKDSFLKKYKNSFYKVKKDVKTNISSTFVREKLQRGKSIRYLTPDEVYFYIKEHHLFEKIEGKK